MVCGTILLTVTLACIFANNAVRFVLLTILLICIQYKLLHISRSSKQNSCNQKSKTRIPNCVESYSFFDKHLSAGNKEKLTLVISLGTFNCTDNIM